MSASIRLAVIGAGSAQFSLGFVRDLCLTESLHGSTIAFMDIDVDRLEVVRTLARRYADELGAELTIEWTTDRREALRDADFVINTALAGGHPQEEAERALGKRHGYYRGLHIAPANQFDLMLSVVRDMEELCADAWLIQSSNPVFEGCTLMTRESDIKIVGLCHGPFGGYLEMSEVMEFDLSQASLESVGFNHIYPNGSCLELCGHHGSGWNGCWRPITRAMPGICHRSCWVTIARERWSKPMRHWRNC